MTALPTRVSGLPLRVRLVAGFSLAMLIVLLAAGGFVYWRVQYDLDRGLDTELRQATQTIAPLVHASGKVTNRDAADATGAAWQVLDAHDTVVSFGGAAGVTPMVNAAKLAEVGSNARTLNVGDFLPASRAPYRLRVSRLSGVATHFVLVGIRRDHRDEALRELLAQLTIAGVGALAITAFVGDRLAHAALRPVERYRRRAAEIAAGAVDLRLDVPEGRHDEVTRLGDTFNDMLATLERSLDREREFVNEASHELRTPITLLTSRVQLARRRKRSVAHHERVLDELQIDLDRLAGLAEELLQLGRAGTDDAAASCDLATLASRVPSDVSVTTLADSAPAGIAEVTAGRILTNLVDNARAHGAAPIRLTVDRPSPDWSRLVVTDAGPGMSAELLVSATQRFTRADDARSRPGAGLGLALVEALVTRAGGELRLCFDGEHARHGTQAQIACTHGPEMTVTVLLPSR